MCAENAKRQRRGIKAQSTPCYLYPAPSMIVTSTVGPGGGYEKYPYLDSGRKQPGHWSRLHFHYGVCTADRPRLLFTWYRIYVLHRHIRKNLLRIMCDLCITGTFRWGLYTPQTLPRASEQFHQGAVSWKCSRYPPLELLSRIVGVLKVIMWDLRVAVNANYTRRA